VSDNFSDIDEFHVDDATWFARHPHSLARAFPIDHGDLLIYRIEERDGPAIPPFDTEKMEIKMGYDAYDAASKGRSRRPRPHQWKEQG
jgi:hypothetical protein